MRQIDPGFAADLASGATTHCACWTLRRGDGVVLGFTDHDEMITLDGVPHQPLLEGGEAAEKLGAQVATSGGGGRALERGDHRGGYPARPL